MDSKMMTVKEFVDKYLKCKTATQLDDLAKQAGIKRYVPFDVKKGMSETIINDKFNSSEGLPVYSSPSRFLYFVVSSISMYTNIEIDLGKSNKEYDLLKESGAIDFITDRIGKDIDEYKAIYDMVWNDIVKNNLTTHAFVARQVTRFGVLCNAGLIKFADQLEKLDVSKLSDILSPKLEKAKKAVSSVKKASSK